MDYEEFKERLNLLLDDLYQAQRNADVLILLRFADQAQPPFQLRVRELHGESYRSIV